jgi:hypothetical protein
MAVPVAGCAGVGAGVGGCELRAGLVALSRALLKPLLGGEGALCKLLDVREERGNVGAGVGDEAAVALCGGANLNTDSN